MASLETKNLDGTSSARNPSFKTHAASLVRTAVAVVGLAVVIAGCGRSSGSTLVARANAICATTN